MFDQGEGAPVVVIPGVQGRWEWMKPAVRALAKRCRAISYTLCGDFGAQFQFDPAAGFDNFLRQLDHVLDRAGVERAALCGVSYGGAIALRYAATRPHRVSSLVLASAPGPGWSPTERQSRYVERPWLRAPRFVLTGPFRLWPEIRTAFPSWIGRWGFGVTHGLRVLCAPAIPSAMATRVVLLQHDVNFESDCAAISAPVLVITGEEALDQVVAVDNTRQYLPRIGHAKYRLLERTGHIGLITRPDLFADVVCEFVNANHH